jgi:hypothetical protein
MILFVTYALRMNHRLPALRVKYFLRTHQPYWPFRVKWTEVRSKKGVEGLEHVCSGERGSVVIRWSITEGLCIEGVVSRTDTVRQCSGVKPT